MTHCHSPFSGGCCKICTHTPATAKRSNHCFHCIFLRISQSWYTAFKIPQDEIGDVPFYVAQRPHLESRIALLCGSASTPTAQPLLVFDFRSSCMKTVCQRR